MQALEASLARWDARGFAHDPFFGDVTLAGMKMKVEQERQRYLKLVREEQPRRRRGGGSAGKDEAAGGELPSSSETRTRQARL